MPNLLFVDLDDTLFQSLKKCPGTEQDSSGWLTPRAYLRDGNPISYSTPQQDRLWDWLSSIGRVIPVTARNYDAFNRVDLPFSDYAILNHGAVILNPDNSVNCEWHDIVMEGVNEAHGFFADIWDTIERLSKEDPGLRPRLISDFNVTWYAVIKHEAADVGALLRLRNAIDEHLAIASGTMYCHFNGNNLAIIPSAIRKELAVNFLLGKLKQNLQGFTIGMGDSLTDLPFMILCDYSIIPSNSQAGAFLRDK